MSFTDVWGIDDGVESRVDTGPTTLHHDAIRGAGFGRVLT